MIRTFLLGLLMTLFVSCGGDSTENSDPTPGPPTPPAKDAISFPDGTTPAPVFAAEGGETTVSFTASGAWTAVATNTRADGWCRVSPAEGAAGAAVLTIAADPNDTPDERSAVIVLSSGQAQERFVVVQKQRDALIVTQSRFEVGTSGGAIEIEVKANVDFDYTLGDDAVEWISLKGTRALETSRLVFAVAANDNTARREGTITIGSGALAETVTVYQAGAEPSIVLTQSNYTVGAEGETVRVEVSSNVDVEVLIPEAAWITESRTRAMSTHTYCFEIAANDTYEARTGRIYLVNQADGLSECVTVTQVQRDALVVANPSYAMDTAGGEIAVAVGHNVDFDVEIGADWISQITTRAYETEMLRFRVAAHTGYDNREGTIVFISKDRRLRQEVKVYQAQKDALVISATKYSLESSGGRFSVEVRANVDFEVEMPDSEWLHAVGTRSMTTHTLNYRVDANNTYESRSAQIRIVSSDESLAQTVTVTQLQKDALVVAASEYTIDQSGGEITMSLGHNVDFDVEIGADWISQITTRAYQTEDLRFRISENPDYEDRETSIAFVSADKALRQTVKIRQAGMRAVEEAKVREYLVKLYKDTDGPNWRHQTNWCSDKPISEWYGVTYEKGRLSLDLYGKYIESNSTYESNNLKGVADLSGCTALVRFDCHINNLTGLNVSGCMALEEVIVSSNYSLAALNVAGCAALNKINCSNCYASLSLNLTDCAALTWLDCSYNHLPNLDVSDCKALQYLDCNTNRELTSLNVIGCNRLEYLNCSFDQELSALDLSDCEMLRTLRCRVTKITSLNLSNCTSLELMDCYGVGLHSLDVSNCKKLTSLNCDTNRQMTRLNVAGCTALTTLDCSHDALTGLDVSGCTALKYLNSEFNKLTHLDVSDCVALETLACRDNLLTSLNFSGCRSLKNLGCQNNQLFQQVPEMFKQLESFSCDYRYVYDGFWNGYGEWVPTYKDQRSGWWYPGEPESGYHGW